MGIQIALVVIGYDLEVEDELAAIFPPLDREDLAWIPGFDEP